MFTNYRQYSRALPLIALLALGCQPNANVRRDMNGFLPLHHAVQDNDLARAEKLLQESGQANAQDLDGVGPLHRAARDGNVAMAKLLIRYKADPNMATRDGWTPLHIATWYKQVEMMKLLLSEDALPNVKTPEGLTPLHMACLKGLPDGIDALMMDWPANVASGRPDVDAPTARARAAAAGYSGGNSLAAGKLLLLGANTRPVDAEGNTALHLLVGKDQLPLVEDLLTRGADVQSRGERRGKNALRPCGGKERPAPGGTAAQTGRALTWPCRPTPRFRIRVAAAIVEDGKILLVKHRKGDDEYWMLPGGGLEHGERSTRPQSASSTRKRASRSRRAPAVRLGEHRAGQTTPHRACLLSGRAHRRRGTGLRRPAGRGTGPAAAGGIAADADSTAFGKETPRRR